MNSQTRRKGIMEKILLGTRGKVMLMLMMVMLMMVIPRLIPRLIPPRLIPRLVRMSREIHLRRNQDRRNQDRKFRI